MCATFAKSSRRTKIKIKGELWLWPKMPILVTFFVNIKYSPSSIRKTRFLNENASTWHGLKVLKHFQAVSSDFKLHQGFSIKKMSFPDVWNFIYNKVTDIIVYKIPYLREYFILTKDVAKIGIFGWFCCKDLAKVAHIGWNKILFLMKIFIINKVPTCKRE